MCTVTGAHMYIAYPALDTSTTIHEHCENIIVEDQDTLIEQSSS